VILVSEVTVSPLLEPFRQPVCPGITLRVATGVADEDRAHGGGGWSCASSIYRQLLAGLGEAAGKAGDFHNACLHLAAESRA